MRYKKYIKFSRRTKNGTRTHINFPGYTKRTRTHQNFQGERSQISSRTFSRRKKYPITRSKISRKASQNCAKTHTNFQDEINNLRKDKISRGAFQKSCKNTYNFSGDHTLRTDIL